jgi:Two component regulator propeller
LAAHASRIYPPYGRCVDPGATKKDDYRLFDVKHGLLANGVFHVSKLDGRIVVGTYGGGMAMYDPAKEKWRVLNIADGLADAFVYDVLKTRDGDIWIAT